MITNNLREYLFLVIAFVVVAWRRVHQITYNYVILNFFRRSFDKYLAHNGRVFWKKGVRKKWGER